MYASIVFLPLLGALIAGWLSLGNRDRAAELITCGCMLLSLLFSIIAFAQVAIGGQPITIDLARWIVSGDFEAMWRLRFDTLTAVMLIVVTGVSSMVHVIPSATCRMTMRGPASWLISACSPSPC